MKATDELMGRFYKHLGELFYAIAQSDGTVRPEEESRLKKLIDQKWAPFEGSTDEYNTDSAYIMESVFQQFDEEIMDAEVAFDDFKVFKKTHEHLFTAEVNALINETANAIAGVFHGKNKSELIMLAKLDRLLKEIPD